MLRRSPVAVSCFIGVINQQQKQYLDSFGRRLQGEHSNHLLKPRDLYNDERVLKTSASSDSGNSRKTSQEDIGLAKRCHIDTASITRRRHVLRGTDWRPRTGRTVHCRDGHMSAGAARTAQVLPPVTFAHYTHTAALFAVQSSIHE